MGFISVAYDEGDPNTYSGIRLSTDKLKHTFCTGEPAIVDWLIASMVSHYLDGHTSESSSVNHFAFDGGPSLELANASCAERELANEKAIAFLQVHGLWREPADAPRPVARKAGPGEIEVLIRGEWHKMSPAEAQHLLDDLREVMWDVEDDGVG